MGTTSLQDLKSKKFWAAVLAEFLGTMLLVLVGCGSALGEPDFVRISLCFGFSVGTIVWAIANVSGGHINPAVTFGFLVTRKISIVRTLFYIIFQTVGAIVGAALLKAFTPELIQGNLATSGPGEGVTMGQAFGVELFITFVLVFTVFSSVDSLRTDIKGSAPLSIGLSIAMCHLWAVPYTGSGMNPARVFGPALISGSWKYHWVYWVGPLIGGAIAAWFYDFLFAVNATPAKFRGFFRRDYNEENFSNHAGRVEPGEANDKTELETRDGP